MRILVLASTFPRWPGDTVPPFVHRLSAGLVARGHEVHILAPHYPGAAKTERMDGLNVHRFQYAPGRLETLAYGGGILENLRRRRTRWALVPTFMFAQLIALLRIVRRERIDAIHAHWVIPQGLLAALARSLIDRPVVTSAHGGDVFAMTKGMRRRLLRFAARRADVCTANSGAVQAVLMRTTGVKPTIIPMGVDLSVFGSGPARRMRRHLPEKGARLLFVGRLVEKKGVRNLVLAMEHLRTTSPLARLLIVGDGPERASLEALVSELGLNGIVEFAGAVRNDQLPAYYASADIFVAPSVVSSEGDTEGLGVVLLEAAACGVPVVASDIGGIGDVVQDERTGLLVEPGNPAAISSAVSRLITDDALRQTVTRGARDLVARHYSWETVVDCFDELFVSLPSRV